MVTIIVHGSRTDRATKELIYKHYHDKLVILQVDTLVPDHLLPGLAQLRTYESYLSARDLFDIDNAALQLSREWFAVDQKDMSLHQGVSLGLVFQENVIMQSVPLLKNIACATRAINIERPDRIYLGQGVSIESWAWKAVARRLGVELIELDHARDEKIVPGDAPLAARSSWARRLGRRLVRDAGRLWHGLRELVGNHSEVPLVLVCRSSANGWLWPELQGSKRIRAVSLDPGRDSATLARTWFRLKQKRCQAEFHERWAILAAKHHNNPVFEYQGVNIWDFLSPTFEKWFSTDFPALALELEQVERSLQRQRPVLLLTQSLPYSGHHKAWSLIAQKLGIPVMCVQHENLLPGYLSHYDVVIADYVIAWGELSRQWFAQKGMDANRVFLVRPPAYESSAVSMAETRYKKDVGGALDRPAIIFTPGYWGPWTAWHSPLDFERALVGIVRAAERLPECDFLVKLHPSSSHPLHEGPDFVNRRINWLQSRNLPNLRIAPLPSSLMDYLGSCDVLITTLSFSTTVIEALLCGKPVIVFDTSRKPDLLPEVRASKAVLFAHEVEELVTAIQHVVGSDAFRRELLQRKDELLQYILATDSSHAEIIESLALRLSRPAQARAPHFLNAEKE
ncbi:MAG: hypothetical protein WBW48_00580 [Anaerolineae bacterium]